MTSDFNDLGRYDMIQRLEKANRIDPEPPKLKTASLIIGGLLAGIGLMLAVQHCTPQPAVIKADCAGCHRKMAFTAYFKGSKNPDQLAEAVLKTRSPRVLAAIHVAGEKRTPHTARNTGWKNKHSGPWQTHERWGKITTNTSVTEMALIAEIALETHTAEQKSDIVKGLNAYGGESDLKNGDYSKRVLAELSTRVP